MTATPMDNAGKPMADVEGLVEELEKAAKRFLETTDPFRTERGTDAELNARYDLIAALRAQHKGDRDG